MSKISLKHSGGNVVSLNSPTNAPSAADVAFKLPNADGSDGQAIVTDGSGNLSFGSVAATRNLIINGAMQVAQRGTSSSTDTNGRHTVDRFQPTWSNINNAITQAQVDTSSGDLPFTKGLRKEFKITNGDNTPATNTQLKINYIIESQDLAGSGWDTVNSSSNVTLSFYVKSSVAQTFVVHLYADDSNKAYAFEYAATTSWTKITHTITGASGLSFNNDNGTGLNIQWYLYMGTDVTNNSFTNNAWGSYSSSSRSRDMTNTWYDTNDATFEITGVQLEVSSVATDFEHRSFGQELALCQRYFFTVAEKGANHSLAFGQNYNTATAFYNIIFPVRMRATPTLDQTTGTNYYQTFSNGSAVKFTEFNSVDTNTANTQRCELRRESLSVTQGAGNFVRYENDNAQVSFSAEL